MIFHVTIFFLYFQSVTLRFCTIFYFFCTSVLSRSWMAILIVINFNFNWQGDIDLCGGDSNDGIDSDCSASSNSGKQVLVGICAMAKKTQSKPMKEILTRLREFEYIRMVVFEEDVILKVCAGPLRAITSLIYSSNPQDPVENWPICDCLVSFHSKGFPLEKAIQYAQLRKPFVVNNLHMQYDIQVRVQPYILLEYLKF